MILHAEKCYKGIPEHEIKYLRVEFVSNLETLRPAEKYFLITWLNKPAETRIVPKVVAQAEENITEVTVRNMLNRFAQMGIVQKVKLRNKSGEVVAWDYIINEYKIIEMIFGKAFWMHQVINDLNIDVNLKHQCYFDEENKIHRYDIQDDVKERLNFDFPFEIGEVYMYEYKGYHNHRQRHAKKPKVVFQQEEVELWLLDENGKEPELDNVVKLKPLPLFEGEELFYEGDNIPF